MLINTVGYSLTGRTDEQCLFFAYGTGSNGKSVFLKTVQALAGEYSTPARVETFTARHARQAGGIPNDIASLAGARVVAVSEVDDGQRLNESLVKDMTGGDAITARFLNREFFSFHPQFKLWMQGNHKPQIRGTDHGIWRRIHLIPFAVTIPPEEKDPALFDKLRAEASGILAWAVRGCLEWRRDGLNPPEEVKAATEAYREEMDILGAFLDERCARAPNITVRAKVIYDAYRQWCDESGQRAYSLKRFGIAMGERGITKGEDRAGIFYQGIGLREDNADNRGQSSRVQPLMTSHVGNTLKNCPQPSTPSAVVGEEVF
jgi:putative DNA primase/helicase